MSFLSVQVRASLLGLSVSLVSACQFEPNVIPIEAAPRACAQAMGTARPEVLLRGRDLQPVAVTRGYDDRIYASHFDFESNRLWIVTDNDSDPCEERVDFDQQLHACRTRHTDPVLALLADPAATQGLFYNSGGTGPRTLLVEAPFGLQNPVPLANGPQALAIDHNQVGHFVQRVDGPSPSVFYKPMPGPVWTQARAYLGAGASRFQIVLGAQEKPWIFIGGLQTQHGGRDGKWDLLCRPDILLRPGIVATDVECLSLSFELGAMAADQSSVQLVGTRELANDQRVVELIRIADEDFAPGSDVDLLGEQQRDAVSLSPLAPNEIAPLPALSIDHDQPVVVYRTSRGLLINHKAGDTWSSYQVAVERLGPPQPVHDRAGNLHVFFLVDDDADGKNDQLQHLTVPRCAL